MTFLYWYIHTIIPKTLQIVPTLGRESLHMVCKHSVYNQNLQKIGKEKSADFAQLEISVVGYADQTK